MKTIKARLTSTFVNMPMMGKLFLLIFLAGALPNISLTIFSYAQTRHILIQNTYDSMAMDNLQIAKGLESQLKSYCQISSLIFTDTRLKNYLLADYKKDYDLVTAYQYIDSTMYSLLASNSNISNITIYIPNQSMSEDGKFIKHLDSNNVGPLEWLISNENSYGNILYHAAYKNENDEMVFSLGRALNYNNQNFTYGYLAMEIKETSIFSELPSNWGAGWISW